MAHLDVSALISEALGNAVQDKLAELRAKYFAEAADIASEEGMRLELEIGLEAARGARSAAARIRRATQPATPAHYCPTCRTTTPAPAATAEALVQAGADHRAECPGAAASEPNCPCAAECLDCDDIGCEQCGDCACTGAGCRSTFHNRNNEECR